MDLQFLTSKIGAKAVAETHGQVLQFVWRKPLNEEEIKDVCDLYAKRIAKKFHLNDEVIKQQLFSLIKSQNHAGHALIPVIYGNLLDKDLDISENIYALMYAITAINNSYEKKQLTKRDFIRSAVLAYDTYQQVTKFIDKLEGTVYNKDQ